MTNKPLTPREREIVQLAAEGLSYAEIAARLFIARRTVEFHMDSLREKTATTSLLKTLAVLGRWEIDDKAAGEAGAK